MDSRELERRSSAVTLSDMEVFIFPELIYSLMLANILSPRIWRWRDDPWFEGIGRQKPYRRILRLKQYIIDHYVFNLDLDTWGLTTKDREMARFAGFIDKKTLAESNALFGYEGDKYYFDIDIRTHFGLDKYDSEVIPYWKTETVEAMDAFVHRPGYATGAGECVSLATLYAAALFIIAGVPLNDIFLMATPLHSQNFVDVDEGILVNNRRLVTRTMWFNGSALSGQARRALENERVTLVAHESGWIHTIYDHATIDPQAYRRFETRLRDFLRTSLTPEILANFLRQSNCQGCFVMRWPLHGTDHYVSMDRVFSYEQNSKYKVSDSTRDKLMAEVAQEEFALSYCPGKIVFNDLESFIRSTPIDLDDPGHVALLKQRINCSCLNAEKAIDDLLRFCQVKPRLPLVTGRTFQPSGEPLGIAPGMDRDAICSRLTALRRTNGMVDMAFYAYRDLAHTEPEPFLTAALQRCPVALAGLVRLPGPEIVAAVSALPDQSIYDGPERMAQPDEVWNFQRGDGLERLLLLALVLREQRRDPAFRIEWGGGRAVLRDRDGGVVCALPSAKQPAGNAWDLSGIGLRGGREDLPTPSAMPPAARRRDPVLGDA